MIDARAFNFYGSYLYCEKTFRAAGKICNDNWHFVAESQLLKSIFIDPNPYIILWWHFKNLLMSSHIEKWFFFCTTPYLKYSECR